MYLKKQLLICSSVHPICRIVSGVRNEVRNAAYGYAAHRRYKKADPAVIIPPRTTISKREQ